MRFSQGPLAEREFRLLLAGRTVSIFGGSMALVATAFAVLEVSGSKADIGYVLAAQQGPKAFFLLLGGVWADRLPRHRLMVVTNIVSGLAQCTAGGLLLTHEATIAVLAALAACNGTAAAFFTPAAQGTVPETVPANLLQAANVMLRLAQNGTTIFATAAAGLLVAGAGPGYAVLVDGLSFFASSAFLAAMRPLRDSAATRTSVLSELRDGFEAFRTRTWLWAIVIQFSFVNAVQSGSMNVLGPVIAQAHLGGAAAWGAILTAQAVGFVASGFLMLRLHPGRLLFVGTLCVFPTALPLLALARPLPALAIGASAFLSGAALEVFGVAWYTVLQREIPRPLLSRVSAWDEFGSVIFIPLALAAAGPISNAIGARATLVGSATVIVGATALVLLARDVRRL